MGHGPLCINGSGDSVILSNNEGNWDLGDVLERNLIVQSVAVSNAQRAVEVRTPLLEPIHAHVLGEQQERLGRCAVWLVVDVNFKSVGVISERVVADELVLNHLTDNLVNSAVHAPERSVLPVTWHDFPVTI